MMNSLSSDTGGYSVAIDARYIGSDLLVTCSGGDRPHIGAVAVAHIGRDDCTDTGPEAVANLICLAGHREDELARAAALKLSNALGCTVTVVAGLHWDVIDRSGIDQVVANVEQLIEQLLDTLLQL